MIILIESNPNIKSLLGFERVLEKGLTGERDVTEYDRTLSRAPGTKDTFSVLPSRKLGGYLNTGLLFETDNPYKDEKSYRTKEWEAILKGVETITKQTELEYKHGRNPGFYTNEIDLEGFKKRYTAADRDKVPYFQQSISQINLNDGATVLDTSKPKEEILYYNMLASSLIANNFNELTADTKYYISKEDETAAIKNSKKRKENMALGRLEELYELKDGTVINFCKLVGGTPSTRINLTEDQAYSELDTFIKKNEAQTRSFNDTYKMFTKDIIKFNTKVKFWDLLTLRIIYKKANEFIWDAPKDDEGNQLAQVRWDRESDVLDYLSNPKYQTEVEILDRSIVAKKRL